MREQVADRQAALAVVGERERRFHQPADRTAIRADRCLSRVGRVVEPLERGRGIERVDLARSPVHEEKDGVLRLRWEMRRPDPRRIQVTLRLVRTRLATKEPVAREQVDECEPREAAPYLPEELPARPAAGRVIGPVADDGLDHGGSPRRWHAVARPSIGVGELVQVKYHPPHSRECFAARVREASWDWLFPRAFGGLASEKCGHRVQLCGLRRPTEGKAIGPNDLRGGIVAGLTYQTIGEVARLPTDELAVE